MCLSLSAALLAYNTLAGLAVRAQGQITAGRALSYHLISIVWSSLKLESNGNTRATQ